MLTGFINKSLQIISVTMIIVIFFVFIYSELVGYGFESDNNHNSHDYCEIIKSATPHIAKFTSYDLSKYKISKTICIHEISVIKICYVYIKKTDLKKTKEPYYIADIYLIDKTFRI